MESTKRRSFSFAVNDLSQVGEVRRFSNQISLNYIGLSELEAGNVAIVAMELASNLIKHGSGGEIIFRSLATEEIRGVEILSLDKGKGMANVVECIQDGFSTTGSCGTGLGAIRRLSSVFEIFSRPQMGTVILIRIESKNQPKKNKRNLRADGEFEIGVISVPIKGESVCGDIWGMNLEAKTNIFMVADGLGHGPMAAQVASESIRVFEAMPDGRPYDILLATNEALKKTRGAAVAIATLNLESKELLYAGIGNITGTIISMENLEMKRQNMLSFNGTVGSEKIHLKESRYQWSEGAVLIMYSDGLTSKQNLEFYPGLLYKHPGIIAGVLYRDFKRGTDDTTILVVRERRF